MTYGAFPSVSRFHNICERVRTNDQPYLPVLKCWDIIVVRHTIMHKNKDIGLRKYHRSRKVRGRESVCRCCDSGMNQFLPFCCTRGHSLKTLRDAFSFAGNALIIFSNQLATAASASFQCLHCTEAGNDAGQGTLKRRGSNTMLFSKPGTFSESPCFRNEKILTSGISFSWILAGSNAY